jgi:hypothetical protein
MRRPLAYSPLTAGQKPASFSLLEVIATDEEREILCRSQQSGQVAASLNSSDSEKMTTAPSSFVSFVAQRAGDMATAILCRFGASIKGKSQPRQMQIVEQLSIGRSTTLVLLEVAGGRLLLSLQPGSAATVTALSAPEREVQNSKQGPQRLESRR